MSTTEARDSFEVYLELKKKYCPGFGCDIYQYESSVLHAFSKVVCGAPTAYKSICMYSDEMIAEVVDDDDFSLWVDAKQRLLNK